MLIRVCVSISWMLDWMWGGKPVTSNRRLLFARWPAPASPDLSSPTPLVHAPTNPQAAAFEAGRQLEAQVADATAALQELRALADELEAEGQARAADAAADRGKAEANGGRAERYVAQQAQLQAGLAAAGYAPEVCAGWGEEVRPASRRVPQAHPH